MDIKAKLNNSYIINTAFVILNSKEDKFYIEVKTDNGLTFKVVMIFNDTGEGNVQNMATRVHHNIIEIHCVNFNNPSGTGISKPIDLAMVDDKHLRMIFWVFALGNNSKKIEYAFLMEE